MRQRTAAFAAGLLFSSALLTQTITVAADSEAIEVHAGDITPSPASLPAINPISLPPVGGGISVSVPANAPTSAISADNRAEVKFCTPAEPEDIATHFGTLHVTPGSLVLMVNAPDALSVYDLHDGTDKDVYIEASGQKLKLAPGKHITLAPSKCTNFAAANKLPFVVYSGSEFEQLSDGMMCFRSKFDINSLILRFAPFKQLLRSEEPRVRKVAEKVLKTAAIMSNYASLARYYQLQASPPQTNVVK